VVLERKNKGVATKLVYLSVDAKDADVLGNEPVYDGDRVIGVTTGGAYGYAVQQSIAFAYVEPNYTEPGSEVRINILGDRRSATVLPEPLYDPGSTRLRA
jgi:dimethylglycine dehydrogenase